MDKKIDGIPKRYKQYILLHDKSNDNIFYLFCSEERFKIDSDEYVETYKFEINDNSRIKAKKLGKLYNLGYSAFSVFDKEQEKWYNFDEI